MSHRYPKPPEDAAPRCQAPVPGGCGRACLWRVDRGKYRNFCPAHQKRYQCKKTLATPIGKTYGEGADGKKLAYIYNPTIGDYKARFVEIASEENLESRPLAQELRIAFGKFLRQQRKNYQLSTYEMGELIGTTGPLIVQIEQGRKGFSEKYAKLFSTILDFPMSEFGRIRKEVVKQRNVVLPLSLFDVDDGD